MTWWKRPFDLVIALTALVLLLPAIAVLALLVRVKLGAPVFFRQQRPGLHGKPFMMVKFRTMTDACDARGNPLPDAERLTRFGKFLRSTSLDELPELWNVVRGDMSLVGPRPPLLRYLPLYTPEQARRHEVRPGVTGWAQVNGRNALTWEEKFALDVWYVDNLSFWIDVRIIVLTVWKILKREGVSQPGKASVTARAPTWTRSCACAAATRFPSSPSTRRSLAPTVRPSAWPWNPRISRRARSGNRCTCSPSLPAARRLVAVWGRSSSATASACPPAPTSAKVICCAWSM